MAKFDDDIEATMNETLNEMADTEEVVEEVKEEPVQEEVVAETSVEEPVAEEQSELPLDVSVEEEIDPSLINPPSTWRPAAKAEWANMSKAAREEVRKREWDATNGIAQMRKEMAQYQEKAEMADRMNEVMQPYQAMIQSAGVTPEEVTKEMMGYAYTLRSGSQQDKTQLIAMMAQRHGVVNELRQAFMNPQGMQQNFQQPLQQPQGPKPLTEEEARAAARAEFEKMQQEQLEEQLANEIYSFQNAVNEDGTLKYPYFDNVKSAMVYVLENSNVSLEEAYNEALWANPETRHLVLNKQQQETESQAAANKHRDQAKKAAANNLDRIPSDAPEQQNRPTGSIDDTLNEVLSNIEKRSA